MSYISKEIAVETIRTKQCVNCTRNMRTACKHCIVQECIDIVKDVKDADAEEVRHGKWEEHESIIGFYIVCSVCGAHYNTNHEGMTKYCSKCGALMDEGKDDGD